MNTKLELVEPTEFETAAMVRALVEVWYGGVVPRETIGDCEWCGLVDHHLVKGECEYCRAISIDYRPAPAPLAADRGEAQCVGCGCTDHAACWDTGKGAPCHWLLLDAEHRLGLCSACRDGQAAAAPLFAYLRDRVALRARLARLDARSAA